jgi:uncharacterized protein YndB with AHSA1/START domain
MSKPEFVYVIYIQTTQQKVWDAIQTPSLTKEFWGHRVNRSDWKIGSRWQHEVYNDPSDVAVVGTVVESAPPHRLVLTWAEPKDAGDPDKTSRVSFDIEDFMGGVRLTVTHGELTEDAYRSISGGWPAVLSSMKTLLESGSAMPMTQRLWKRAG